MHFLNSILSDKTKRLRHELVDHALWKAIVSGKLEKKRLALFALQDYWLIQQVRRIDALTIARIVDRELQELLVNRMTMQGRFKGTIFDFGRGVGLTQEDFNQVVPVAGCMALTTFFYWMIDYGSDIEKIASIFASVGVFADICMKVYKPLMKQYQLTEQQVTFFSAHKFVEEKVDPISSRLEELCKTQKEKKLADQTVFISYQFEKLFYDTILESPLTF